MAGLIFFVMYMIIVMHDWSGEHSKDMPHGYQPPSHWDDITYH